MGETEVTTNYVCPFCKQRRLATRHRLYDVAEEVPSYQIICLDCGARGPLATTEADALELWEKDRR